VRESYRTLAGPCRHEIDKVKGSRFLGLAAPARDEAEAQALLLAARREFHDARHHCSAWRLGAGGEVFRWSDDGEPSGSAGRPLLAALEGRELVDAAVVVVRWFGGTKLGVGGLVRAYGEAAAAVLDRAPQELVTLRRRFELLHAYELSGPVAALLAEFELAPVEAEYGARVRLVVELPLARCEAFLAAHTERTAGRGELREVAPGGRLADDPGPG